MAAKVSAFVLPQALVTVRQEAWFDIEQVVRAWDDNPELTEYGPASLLYGLLDVIVDGHFDTVQRMDDRIEEIEDELFVDRPQMDVQRATYELRKTLVSLRKLVLPMREVVGSLLHNDVARHGGELTERYQDLYDHVLRATEWADSLRDLVTTIFETNLSLADAAAQPGGQAAVRVGGDHRRAHRGDRLLRAERALPRVRAVGRLRGQHADHPAARGRLLRLLQEEGLAVSQPATVSSTFWNSFTLE